MKALLIWKDNGGYSNGCKIWLKNKFYNTEFSNIEQYFKEHNLKYILKPSNTIKLLDNIEYGLRPTAQSSRAGENSFREIKNKIISMSYIVIDGPYEYSNNLFGTRYKWDGLAIYDENLNINELCNNSYPDIIRINNNIKKHKFKNGKLMISQSLSQEWIDKSQECILIEAKSQKEQGTLEEKMPYALSAIYKIMEQSLTL